MEINIQSIHFDATERLKEFVTQKLKKLAHFDEHINSAEVYLRLDKSQDMENKMVEIKLNNGLFAKKQAKTFEEATDLSIEALRKQLEKTKDKTQR